MAPPSGSETGGWGELLARCRADPSIKRVQAGDFAFPLGVYPVPEEQSSVKPRAGYTVSFEPADGDSGEGDWEEWPDRYVFDILVSANRLDGLCRALFSLLPGRVYPILDVLGHDAYREVDPYVSYELVGQERFLDAVRKFRDYLFEDGLVGFGAMSEEPFIYVFVDEHKIVTMRVETALRDKAETVLAAFDLEPLDSLSGADSATHEHRGVLQAPDDRPDLASADEIVEILRQEWRLTLNIDPDANVDDEGGDLGVTAWRCVVRITPDGSVDADETDEADEHNGSAKAGTADGVEPAQDGGEWFAECLLTAGSMNEAERMTLDSLTTLAPDLDPESVEAQFMAADRVLPEQFNEALSALGITPDVSERRVWHVRRLGEDGDAPAGDGARAE